ncbi:MAG: Fis family transcriptional regulator [Candidatus Schekmanbacteria bacterium RIFCSPHIGHO2_02_FULL_38_11]|uniref:Fis family transcriptional regulator n=1 Tax=Candidatus Schekmanbacteria bacterium RIFCSPLOWO2_12_FULL_38_15 TaxID=1817883 RepID=A0A1F7SLR7_9BACT|nr:MAG: Fis family transcriptional regulator [Candidatus Schekmanbacteria bacterium GWA2_38_9]OGL48292.1 MAG: Fis family transcriptional regulator [Candidatus Schekmanbacteria bacterium RIFCSPLOWO2_02_FULL_38_14]OGL49938.1 MAG: Fis family transcriptional regulator [Candidatus Schekmanbacteria bacterium RIFCSPHIGHO2_02_FULL_38_11]OGL54154.1 MAG: Fis family transcriptional regulator [Candidatus Schekmanbacteria bacterium RIFCSPLOWO2_12_FULL_38_15]
MTPKKILIVDDESTIRMSLARILEKEGYAVAQAENGKKAIELLKKEPFHLILTDLKMPEVDGFEVLKQAKSISPDSVVIVLTAYVSVESAISAMKAGAYDYLSKPINIDEVRIVIRKALNQMTLVEENILLKKQLKGKYRFENIIGVSPQMQKVYQLMERVIETDSTILIQGESGTGKELVAKAIHYNSYRKNHPFVTINCGAIPKDLLESEFFGHVKGSYTGAFYDRTGKFELANKGTIFLDEIGTMAPDLQVKVLRVFQERELEKVGDSRKIKVDVRVISATNVNLEDLVTKGLFRDDLFYRLNVISLTLPPLRERVEDIPLLTSTFLKRFCKEMEKGEKKVSNSTMEFLIKYHWPGNVRELENTIERALALADGKLITPKHLSPKIINLPPSVEWHGIKIPDEGIDLNSIVKNLEVDLINQALRKSNGVKSKAAKLLKVNRTTLVEKMKKIGLS